MLWIKDYIFDYCININKFGVVWGVGDNIIFFFGGLKMEFLLFSIVVRMWWEIMGWYLYVELFFGVNDFIVVVNFLLRFSLEFKVVCRLVLSGCFNVIEFIKNIFDSVMGFIFFFFGNIIFLIVLIV